MCFYFAVMNYNGYIIKAAACDILFAVQNNKSAFVGGTYLFLWNTPPYFLVMEYTLKSYSEGSPWSALCSLYADFPWAFQTHIHPFLYL